MVLLSHIHLTARSGPEHAESLQNYKEPLYGHNRDIIHQIGVFEAGELVFQRLCNL